MAWRRRYAPGADMRWSRAVADVRDEQAIGHVVEETREALGPVTMLVNNAAVRRETWISGDIFGN
jgi:NAD(P)-dependent dehydrogenase (short-subunit alcohol dehydrogenase family)